MSIDKKYKEKRDQIMAYLGSDFRHNPTIPHPFIIEFNGSPHSGKTSTITEIDKLLRRHGFRVLRLQESGEAIRHIERKTPIYNIRTGLHSLINILDHGHGYNYDVIIFERGIFDAYNWMTYWAEKNKKHRQELETAKKFFLTSFWSNMVDRIYFMVCSPTKARKREFEVSLSDNINTSNVDMVKFYRQSFKKLSQKFLQIKLIDTTNLNRKEVAEKIALDVLKMMEEKAKKTFKKTLTKGF